MSDEAFRLYAADSPQLAKTVRSRLLKLQQEHIAMLADALDWPDFKARRGTIEGIELALMICGQVEKEERA